MISSSQIRAALTSRLESCGLFESVINRPAAELSAALETLRASPDSLAVIVASGGAWSHTMALEDENIPARAEKRKEFEILVTCKDLRHSDTGAPDCEAIVDQLSEVLLWSDIGLPGLICLPIGDEPMVIELDERRGREAWKVTIELREQLIP